MNQWKVFQTHQVYINDVPEPLPRDMGGKWVWLKEAILSTPLDTWMSTLVPNRQEATRAQSVINNKYTKERLKRDGKRIRTRLLADGDTKNGVWKVHWYIEQNTQ